MKKKNALNSRRSTPISDGIGEDLNKLTNLLADHTRGLDAYLKKQGKNIDNVKRKHHQARSGDGHRNPSPPFPNSLKFIRSALFLVNKNSD